MKATLMKLSRLWLTGLLCLQLVACAAWAGSQASGNPSVTVHSGISVSENNADESMTTAITEENADKADNGVETRPADAGAAARSSGPEADSIENRTEEQEYEPVIMVIDNEAESADAVEVQADARDADADQDVVSEDSGKTADAAKGRSYPRTAAWSSISTMPIWWK
jgi:hypothetical protein